MGLFDFLKPPSVADLKARRDVDGLIKRLFAQGGKQAIEAGGALGEIGGVKGVDALLKACIDNNPNIRVAGALCLGLIRDPAAYPRLIQILQTRNLPAAVRAMACSSLGLIGNRAAEGALLEALDEPQVQMLAAYALASVGGKRAADALFARRNDRDLRHPAIVALAKMKDPRALPLIHEALSESSDPGRRVELIRALGNIGGPEAAATLSGVLSAGQDQGLEKEIRDALSKCR